VRCTPIQVTARRLDPRPQASYCCAARGCLHAPQVMYRAPVPALGSRSEHKPEGRDRHAGRQAPAACIPEPAAYVGCHTLTLDKIFIHVNSRCGVHSGCAVRAVPVLGIPTHTQGSGPLGHCAPVSCSWDSIPLRNCPVRREGLVATLKGRSLGIAGEKCRGEANRRALSSVGPG
jgi:hypothetical protein